MMLNINGEARECASQTLMDLLTELSIEGRVATALNEEFVPEGLRAQTQLSSGDRIEILAPMQGG